MLCTGAGCDGACKVSNGAPAIRRDEAATVPGDDGNCGMRLPRDGLRTVKGVGHGSMYTVWNRGLVLLHLMNSTARKRACLFSSRQHSTPCPRDNLMNPMS